MGCRSDDSTAPDSDPDGLGPGARALYASLIEHVGDLTKAAATLADTDIDEALNVLVRLHLVHRSGEDRFEALSPSEAAEEVLGPREARVHQELRDCADLRAELRELAPLYRDATRVSEVLASSELLTDGGEVRDRMGEIRDGVRQCIYSAHPTMATPEVLKSAVEEDGEMLRRGIVFRDLYTHTARRYHHSLQYLKSMAEMGAEIRTASIIPARMVLIDRSFALIPAPTMGASAALVRDQAVVDYLHLIFEFLWERGQDFSDTTDEGDDYVPFEIQTAILHELAEGRTDEAIARRLGISSRTLRRHLSQLFESLGVDTRFQLGIAAVRRGLLSSDYEDPGAAPPV
ncbi:helix-turn-helix domain-containing protein [Flexivirga oryzae]|uniref:DNA-binding CsgD family transcriptional regulator n=1 Tax=Flexivirga oryzae TaxID=1794944 RepID=A0A839NDI2_9MICO|nr:helix-turn-helix transcriptional regulator [Flexivirga oryzae]MBB2893235.1 DNA-binding CsgD family transcriptional regulator [Flexivirga oryzae]